MFCTLFSAFGPEPIRARMDELKPPKEHYDELKHLLEAAHGVHPVGAENLAVEILRGTTLPSVRLRWWAADKLLAWDRPRA